MAIKRLSPPGISHPSCLCHRLASSLLFHILSYKGDVLSPTVNMVRMSSAFWHKAQRWCTNCFACTPTDLLTIEACLRPLDLLLFYTKRLANLLVVCSSPEINPATAHLAPSLQTSCLHHHALYYRNLLFRNAGSCLCILLLQPRPPSKNRAHLPLDAVPNSLLFLLGPDGHDPLPLSPNTCLVNSVTG